MANHITGIDHVLVAVADLDAAAERWRRLGFALTPRGGHPQWGTANRCIMFAADYLELIGAVGKGAKADQLAGLVRDRGAGISGLALASADAAATAAALRRAGVAVGEPQALSRVIESPEGSVRPEFAVLDLPSGTLPGTAAIVSQHLTPELMRRPEWLEHPNGAVAVVSLTIVTDEPEAARPALEAVFGPASTTATDNTVAVHTGHGLILLARPDEVAQLHPDADLDTPRPVPAAVALTLAVTDPRRTAAHLTAQGIPFGRHADGSIAVSPQDADGVLLEFAAG